MINKIKDLDSKFINAGFDEEGHLIANCTKCNENGILVEDHECSNIDSSKEEKIEQLKIALRCVQALEMKFEKGIEILKEAGFDYSNRFDYPATKFVSDMVDKAVKECTNQL